MYKLLLCGRYLRTRYLAFVCIVSVMLGVATLIVVNAVMSGFSTKLKDRLHGVLSDVVVDTDNLSGFADPPDVLLAKVMASPAGPKIAAATPTVEVFAIMQYRGGRPDGPLITKPVRLIGVDPAGRAAVGGFSEYLVRQNGHPAPSFDLTPDALRRHDANARELERADALAVPEPKAGAIRLPDAPPPPDLAAMTEGMPVPKLHGAIPGYTLAHFRFRDGGQVVEETALYPGDAVTITTVGGESLRPVSGTFLVADYLKTEMSEYDQSFVYVPLDQLQAIRGMGGRCSALQIKLKDYEADKAFVVEEIQKLFPYRAGVRVSTWEDQQGPLLQAIDVERGILNLLLFMIVGVAGFSILAIFTMIVSEKVRDIGVMKALGASSWGVMSIFLGYGLLLGAVGCALGTALGLWITANINEIEAGLTKLTGRAVFPRDVYYFKDIPTNVDPAVVALVNVGAVAVAVVFSLLPAYRAARLHPVRALRFE